LRQVRAELCGAVDPSGGGVNSLGLSRNMVVWEKQVQTAAGATGEHRLSAEGGRDLEGITEFYVRVRMAYKKSPGGSPANTMGRLAVHAVRGVP